MMTRARVSRRGVVLVAAMVALMVIMLLSAVVARGVAVQHRQMRLQHQRQQAFWFAQSAVQRAVIRLRDSPEYTGESWKIDIPLEGEPRNAVADIRIETSPNDSQLRTVVIDARWPDHPIDRVLEQRRFSISVSDSGDSP